MIIVTRFFFSGYSALTIWPFIFIKDKSLRSNKLLINHEKIHLRQQIDLLWAPFFVWYLLEFVLKLIKYKNWQTAYYAISFEREAYQNEQNFEYTQNRKWGAFIKYL